MDHLLRGVCINGEEIRLHAAITQIRGDWKWQRDTWVPNGVSILHLHVGLFYIYIYVYLYHFQKNIYIDQYPLWESRDMFEIEVASSSHITGRNGLTYLLATTAIVFATSVGRWFLHPCCHHQNRKGQMVLDITLRVFWQSVSNLAPAVTQVNFRFCLVYFCLNLLYSDF